MGRKIILAGAAAAALVLAGIGYATIAGSGEEIKACYDNQSGQVRIYEADGVPKGCGKNEQAVSWNTIGPSGPEGDKGDKGDKGDQGPPGPPGSPAGAPCTTSSADEGTVEMTVGSDDSVTFTCVSTTPPPPPPPPPTDADKDGFSPPLDCDDTNAAINPAAVEVPGDGKDNDCDGRIDEGP